jgi:2-succinyl-5-enolpyruvyl-6-hydroxy-3-cyclohexene-1-carboxylate synthase
MAHRTWRSPRPLEEGKNDGQSLSSDSPSHADVLGRYVGAFVDELVASGVEQVCLCPGSRSTPLAVTFARHPGIKVWTHLDERSCAYFALGVAKASGKPVAVLCSSGTAAVNFAPAVVEAYHANVPLIVLTADRPQELRDLGSNQTIDQVKLFGPHVKWFAEMLLPEASAQAIRYVRIAAARAASTATSAPVGPVHLNFPFREPLMPAPIAWPELEGRRSSSRALSRAVPDSRQVESVAQELRKAQRGLIVCGPQGDGRFPKELADLAKMCGLPVLADPLSGLRSGGNDANTLGSYDNFLRSPRVVVSLQPDLVLRFGAPPTSKAMATYLQRHAGSRQVQVCPAGIWHDPDLTASQVVEADAAEFCARVLDALEASSASGPFVDTSWLQAWQNLDRVARESVAQALAGEECASEPSAILDLADVFPDGATLVAGNSMPVRDLDSFLSAGPKPARFLANRGASGIDGVISTALGAAAVSERPLVLVLGDLSFYHDMNGLLAARRFGLRATIVLINNDGGGIFSFLPQHEQEREHFETLFGTPHGLDFAPVAELYGVDFQRVTTREGYRAALKASFFAPDVQVIEIKTDREENLKLHQRIWDEVARAVEPLVMDKAASP